MNEFAHHYHPYFLMDELEPGWVRVERFVITEEVSGESRCEAALVVDGAALEPRALLRKLASVVIVRDDGKLIGRFDGVVLKTSERATSVVARQELRVVLESPLTLLRYSSDFRIRQDQTTREIVSDILISAGFAPPSIEFRLEQSARKRVTATQYGESMRAFVDRLLEEDGVFWFVEHGEGGPKLVFGDNPRAWVRAEDAEIPYKDVFGVNADQSVHNIEAFARARPSKVTLRDHDFTKPALGLDAVKEDATAFGREHYDFPGGYQDTANGDRRVLAVATAHVASSAGLLVRGQALALRAGHVCTLTDTPAAQHDGEYVVLRAYHAWQQGTESRPDELRSAARLLPFAQPFAPLPRTPRPQARGALAVITVPPGEAIHCDEHGRVKVRFLWDRHGKQDDQSSGWVRVAQLHTSGSIAIPRNEWEVLVEFEDGDPERPIVLGRLYNGAQTPTDALPAGRSNSVLTSYSTPGGGGFNEIRMNDGSGSELISVHAEKDLNLVVANNKEHTVTNGATVGVKVDQTRSIGANETQLVGAAQQLSVGSTQSWSVGASRTKTVGGGEQHQVTGTRTTTIGAGHTTLTPLSDSTTVTGSLTETVSGLCVEAAGLGVGLAVAGSTSITVGSARVEAVATGKSDITVGARASTIGGAFVNVSTKDVEFNTAGAKATAVGGAWLASAGSNAELSSGGALSIMVGGAIAFTAGEIVMKVGSSSITIKGGSVVLKASEVKLTATGPAAELAPMPASK